MTTPEDPRVTQLRIEIGQFEIARRNHADWCKSEIQQRERQIEILLEAEQRRMKMEAEHAAVVS